jgi:hypothetical protein
MRRPHTIVLVAAALASALVAAAAAAGSAATSTPWTRISGPTAPGAQLGLARTPDGVLHVIWNRGATPTSIFETRLSSAGKTVGTSTVAGGWNGNNGLALVVMRDRTLQLFAVGNGGINTFTAPSGGGSWSHGGAAWGGPVAESSGVIGATLTKDGQPVTAWRGFAAEGVPPGSIPSNAYQGGMTESFLATDAATGAVVLSGATNAGQGGVYVQKVLPAPGPRVVLPPLAKDWGNGVSSRLGAPGVYVAYADGKSVRLYRYGGASRTLARGPYLSATLCPGPAGRLWAAWGDPTGLYVTRSSRSAGALEPVQKLKLPPSTNGLTFLQCEGSAGPIDLFANLTTGTAGGFWHTHVLARLTVHASVARTKAGAKVTISVRDAGDPVAAASVTVAGRQLKTGSGGTVTLVLRPGSYSARTTAPGYAPDSSSFHV